MRDKIRVMDDYYLPWTANAEFKSLAIQPRHHEQDIVVSPCGAEHWISTDLFKFRIYAERQQWHVTGLCPKNQIPLFSQFCDEIVIVDDNPCWYDLATSNGSLVSHLHEQQVNIEAGGLRSRFSTAVSDQEVIDRFKTKEVVILRSSYDLFRSIKHELPSKVIVVEYKKEHNRRNLNGIDTIGSDHRFQRELIQKIGKDNYMAIQILASNFLNWQFMCSGGSSNLMCVLPVKYLFLKDSTINQSVETIVKGFMTARGCDGMPCFNSFKCPSEIDRGFDLLSSLEKPELSI